MRALRCGDTLSPKFNLLYLIFIAPMPQAPNHPPKWWGNSQFVTILLLAPRAGYVTIWSLKT
jgi:hypothetical protein